jgi:hypothetical protein
MCMHACTVLGWFAGAGGSNDGEPVATAMAALDGVAPPPSATPAWYVQRLALILLQLLSLLVIVLLYANCV